MTRRERPLLGEPVDDETLGELIGAVAAVEEVAGVVPSYFEIVTAAVAPLASRRQLAPIACARIRRTGNASTRAARGAGSSRPPATHRSRRRAPLGIWF